MTGDKIQKNKKYNRARCIKNALAALVKNKKQANLNLIASNE